MRRRNPLGPLEFAFFDNFIRQPNFLSRIGPDPPFCGLKGGFLLPARGSYAFFLGPLCNRLVEHWGKGPRQAASCTLCCILCRACIFHLTPLRLILNHEP